MNYFLFWLSFILFFVNIGFTIYKIVKFVKNRQLNVIDTKNEHIISGLICLSGLSMFGIFGSVALMNSWPMSAGDLVMMIFGSTIFGIAFYTFFVSFFVYYYKPTLEKKSRKFLRIAMFVSIPLMIIFVIMMLDGMAEYFYYPFTCNITFTSEGVFFGRGANDGSGGYQRYDGFAIYWYGVIILCGALIAYFVSDHYMYKQYKRHGIIDTLFIVVFLVGILGARFWYCFVLEYDRYFGPHATSNFFAFQDGGLAIMGGVIFGVIAALIYLSIFRRYLNIRNVFDLLLPTVIIAQAIGRWGNFFNHEVYGALLSAEGLRNVPLVSSEMWFIPKFIRYQMSTVFTNGEPGAYMWIPLFLIECITNLSGYFIIRYAIGKPLKKYLSFGDLAALYVSWYGLTRIILEPVRVSSFEYSNSLATAWAMLFGGLGVVLLFHIYDDIRWGHYGPLEKWFAKTFKINLHFEKANKEKNPYSVVARHIEEANAANKHD